MGRRLRPGIASEAEICGYLSEWRDELMAKLEDLARTAEMNNDDLVLSAQAWSAYESLRKHRESEADKREAMRVKGKRK